MHFRSASVFLSVGLFAVSCANRNFGDSATRSVPDGSAHSPSVHVDPMAFNALNMWRDGTGNAVMNFPENYDSATEQTTSDGIFIIHPDTFLDDKNFSLGTTTEGATVESTVLHYPEKDGRNLQLKFSPMADREMSHSDAVRHCKRAGLRLPTAQELLDFCAAGTARDRFDGKYRNHRCKEGQYGFWSASVYTAGSAWEFSNIGQLRFYLRSAKNQVRCAGTP